MVPEDIDVDALYNTAMEGESTDIPMSGEPEVTPKTPVIETPQELEFTYKGKQIKAPYTDPRVKTWASQGYDYAQRVEGFNKQQLEFEAKQKSFSEIETKYKPIDEWARQNPEKWQALLEGWQKAQQDGTDQKTQLPPEIVQRLEKYDQVFKKLEEKEQQETIQREDSELDADIKSVREQYPHLDFDAPTHDGKSLEYRVMEYGTSRGINSFADAFYAFNHKNLFKLAETKGKEAVDKDIQKKTRLGLLGKTAAPTKGLTQPSDVRGRSYEDLLDEAKQEFNVS